MCMKYSVGFTKIDAQFSSFKKVTVLKSLVLTVRNSMGIQDFGIFLTEIYYLFQWLQLLSRFQRSFFLIGYLGLH